MDPSKIVARKSAPPPPPEEDQASQEKDSASWHTEDDFLMDIGEPFPGPTPACPAQDQLQAGKAAPREPLQQTSDPNHASTPPTGGTKKRANRRKAGKENASKASTSPAPNVDELIASLEATVNGSGPPAPPLVPPPLPPPPPPPPPLPSALPPTASSSESANIGEKEKGNASSSSSAGNASGKKRKPRVSKQQKRLQQQQQQNDGNKGSQRTEGRVSNASVPQPLPPLSSDSPNPPTSSSSSSSSRAAGKIKNKDFFPSHNRKWTAGTPKQLASKPSAYSIKPGTSTTSTRSDTNDITSFKFVPDTDEKVDLVIQTILGENEGREKRLAPSLTLHTLPTVHSSDVTGIEPAAAPGARPMEDDDKFITVVDFTSKYPPERQVLHSVPKKTSIVFLLLSRPALSRKRWSFPNHETAADFINEVICTLYEDDYPYADAYDRSGKWGLFSTLLLSTENPEAVEEFRRHLSRNSHKGMDYDTFPKEVATQKPDISILLRNNMKSFAHEVIPKVLFKRNADKLAGTLRVLSTRQFPEGETSQRGESKDNWRQIDLKGDDQVMRCLRFIPESYPFKLGVEMVQIKGGLRPQEPVDSVQLGKRTWTASTSGAPTPILSPVPTPITGARDVPAKRGRGRKNLGGSRLSLP